MSPHNNQVSSLEKVDPRHNSLYHGFLDDRRYATRRLFQGSEFTDKNKIGLNFRKLKIFHSF